MTTEWLIYLLTDWLMDWLTEWLIDWLTYWLADWQIFWMTDWEMYRMTGWLTDWRQIVRLTDWLFVWCSPWEPQTPPCTNTSSKILTLPPETHWFASLVPPWRIHSGPRQSCKSPPVALASGLSRTTLQLHTSKLLPLPLASCKGHALPGNWEQRV